MAPISLLFCSQADGCLTHTHKGGEPQSTFGNNCIVVSDRPHPCAEWQNHAPYDVVIYWVDFEGREKGAVVLAAGDRHAGGSYPGHVSRFVITSICFGSGCLFLWVRLNGRTPLSRRGGFLHPSRSAARYLICARSIQICTAVLLTPPHKITIVSKHSPRLFLWRTQQ